MWPPRLSEKQAQGRDWEQAALRHLKRHGLALVEANFSCKGGEIDRPQLMFAALDAGQLRQVRSALGTSLPTYAVSAANPGRTPGVSVPELDGIRLLDMPWTTQPDHPQVMIYPRPLEAQPVDGSLDMQRLYALGIDAFRVARELALRPGANFELDGVTGRLSVRMNNGAWTLRRDETAAVYRDGIGFEAVQIAQ